MSDSPVVDPSSLERMVQYAFCNGIAYGSPHTPETKLHPERNSAVHAPFTVDPYPIDADAFKLAMSLASSFNHLVDVIAQDSEWLLSTLKSTAVHDEFTGKLMDIYRGVLAEGVRQKATLGIIRSDYMFHNAISGDTSRGILQVELNTIASSFGCLSNKISDMHRLFDAASGEALPPNDSIRDIARGMVAANGEYRRQTNATETVVLFIVQHGERNFSDQRLLEYEILRQGGVSVLRASLADVAARATVGQDGALSYDAVEVAVVYFRAGYTPDDYPGVAEWEARRTIEHSKAIKCPDIATHLVGTKKVQQVLAVPGQLERFMPAAECARLRTVFAGLYSLDSSDYSTGGEEIVAEAIQRALNDPNGYVLKPQREGGGNNFYKDEMKHKLQTLSAEALSAYILMERIVPRPQDATMVRFGCPLRCRTICELGVFGLLLRGENNERIVNECGGYLLRVKPVDADEGGVAAGYSVLSSAKLDN